MCCECLNQGQVGKERALSQQSLIRLLGIWDDTGKYRWEASIRIQCIPGRFHKPV